MLALSMFVLVLRPVAVVVLSSMFWSSEHVLVLRTCLFWSSGQWRWWSGPSRAPYHLSQAILILILILIFLHDCVFAELEGVTEPDGRHEEPRRRDAAEPAEPHH